MLLILFSPIELITQARKGLFGSVIADKKINFSLIPSYISSYLFITGCIQTICEKESINKIQSLQKLLDFMSKTESKNVFFILELGEFLGIDGNELLNSKNIQ